MPKSKRAKVVHLTKVEKKGKEGTLKQFSNVQESAERYRYIFVFAVDNMRNAYLKDVRARLPDSRLFFGKTKVIAKALGMSPEEELLPNVSGLTPFLVGDVGLVCTDSSPSDILQFFSDYVQTDFARAGTTAPRSFTIPDGVVHSRGGEIPTEEDLPLPHDLEARVRGLGMPTKLVKGKVMLDGDYEVCREGQVLNSHQTSLLKTFGVTMAEFKVQIKAYYDSSSHEVIEPVDPEAG